MTYDFTDPTTPCGPRAFGDDVVRADHAATPTGILLKSRCCPTSMPNTALGSHLPVRRCASRPM